MLKPEMILNLKQFGMNEYEAKSYAVLLKRGPLTASLISEYSQVPQSKVYEVMKSLRGKSFIEYFGTKPQRFKAIDPAFVLKNVLDFKKKQLDKLEKKSTELISGLKADTSIAEQEVWMSTGRDMFLRKFAEAAKNATTEIKLMTTDFTRNYDLDHALLGAVKQKVTIRALAPLELEYAGRIRARWYKNIGSFIKLANAPHHNFVIVDNAVAYIMINDNPEFSFITSTNRAIVDAVSHYFDHLWECGDDFG